MNKYITFCWLFLSVLSLLSVQAETSMETVIDGGIYIKNGIKYRKFATSFGSIFVLDSSKLSEHNIETAQCLSNMGNGIAQISQPALVGTEKNISRNDNWKSYAALIQKTIKSKCDGSVVNQLPVEPHLDLGISHSIKDWKGNSTDVKVFNRDLQPNLNLGINF